MFKESRPGAVTPKQAATERGQLYGQPIEFYWKIRLERLKKALEANNFEVYLSDNAADAKSKKIGILGRTCPVRTE